MKAKFEYKAERLENKTITNIESLLDKYAHQGFELDQINGQLFIFKKRIETRGRKKTIKV